MSASPRTELPAIAAAQTIPRPGDVAANLEQHDRLARAAAERGARVLVFPELSLTGYELRDAEELAFAEEDERLAPLRDRASALGLTLVVGAPVRVAGHLHIGALVLAPDRSVELYTKRHLGSFPSSVNPGGDVPPPEATVFRPGDRDPLVRFDGHTAAVAICADVGHASHAERAARRGAQAYLASMFVVPAEFEGDARKLATYAARHAMSVVLANFGGPTGGLASAGRSSIWSERGELLARLDAGGAGLVVAARDAAGWRAETALLANV